MLYMKTFILIMWHEYFRYKFYAFTRVKYYVFQKIKLNTSLINLIKVIKLERSKGIFLRTFSPSPYYC